MVCCKAVALAAICVSIADGARIKTASKRIIEEQPLADQLSRAASAASISHRDDELSLDELLAPDDRVMPATARPSVPATALQMALPSTPSKKRKATEAFDGALQDQVGQNRVATEAEKNEMLRGNSSADDLGLGLDKVEHGGIEMELDVNELLDYMAVPLEDEANGSLVRSVEQAQTVGASIDDLLGQDDVEFVEAMQKYEEKKCERLRSGGALKRGLLKECCKLAGIWTNCDHGPRFLANMLRRFNHVCKRFPSLPPHRIAKAASLQELGLLPKAADGEGSGSGIEKWLQVNWRQNSNNTAKDPRVGPVRRGVTAKDPRVGPVRRRNV